MLNVSESLLRLWEQRFQVVRPMRNNAGRRRYSAKDISLLKHIHELLNVKGYSYTYAAELLANTHHLGAHKRTMRCEDANEALHLLTSAKLHTNNPTAVAKIEAVEQFLRENSPISPQKQENNI